MASRNSPHVALLRLVSWAVATVAVWTSLKGGDYLGLILGGTLAGYLVATQPRRKKS